LKNSLKKQITHSSKSQKMNTRIKATPKLMNFSLKPDLLMKRVGSDGEVNPTQSGSKLGWILTTHLILTTRRVTRLNTQKPRSWQHVSPLILIALEQVQITQINLTLDNSNNPNEKSDSIDSKIRVYLHDLHALI